MVLHIVVPPEWPGSVSCCIVCRAQIERASASRTEQQLLFPQASQFVRTSDFVSAKHTTAASGIGSLLGNAQIDDYIFEPCGYSMNGLEGAAFSTIHITPEDGFSYASLELTGYPAEGVDPSGVVGKVGPALPCSTICLLSSGFVNRDTTLEVYCKDVIRFDPPKYPPGHCFQMGRTNVNDASAQA